MQVDASLQSQNNCTRTCDGWPNGFASRLTSSRKSQKSRKFHVHTIDLWSACVELHWGPNGKKNLSTNLSLTRVNSSHHKWVAKQNTARMLHWFTSLFGQGFKTSQAGLGLGWLGTFEQSHCGHVCVSVLYSDSNLFRFRNSFPLVTKHQKLCRSDKCPYYMATFISTNRPTFHPFKLKCLLAGNNKWNIDFKKKHYNILSLNSFKLHFGMVLKLWMN